MSVSLALGRGRALASDLPACVLGILNATPDSFWEGSRAATVEQGVARALAMESDGAHCIDIGGESTRPSADYVSLDEELSRVVPLVEGIRSRSAIPISIDTRKAEVFRAAFDAGADILNDVSACMDDPKMVPLVAELGVPVILMHKKGDPKTMQANPSYDDVVSEVADWLVARARTVESAGVERSRIILDPGIGFGKRHEDNLDLLAGLAEIASRGYPVLMALSRKNSIGVMTGRETGSRLAGTLAANQWAVGRGATYLRVHDVAETIDMLKVLRGIIARGVH